MKQYLTLLLECLLLVVLNTSQVETIQTVPSGDGAVKIECGRVPSDKINITYIGEAFSVYSARGEYLCYLEKVSPILYVVYGANKQESGCGMDWNEPLKTYSIRVHVQLNLVVTEMDKYYELECVYGSLSEGQQMVHILDRWVFSDEVVPDGEYGDVGSTTLAGSGFFSIKLINQWNEASIQLKARDKVKVQIEMIQKQVFVDSVITECRFEHAVDGPVHFLQRIMHDGCGDGNILEKSESFITVKRGRMYETRLFDINFLQGRSHVRLHCLVVTCTPSTTCRAVCPTSKEILPQIAEFMVGTFSISSDTFSVNTFDDCTKEAIDGKSAVVILVPPSTTTKSTTTTTVTTTTSTTVTTTTPTTSVMTTTRLTTSTSPTTTRTTTTTRKMDSMQTTPMSDFDNPAILPYIITVIILSVVSLGLLIGVVILSCKLYTQHIDRRFAYMNRMLGIEDKSKKQPGDPMTRPILALSPSHSEASSIHDSVRGSRGQLIPRSDLLERSHMSRSDSYEKSRGQSMLRLSGSNIRSEPLESHRPEMRERIYAPSSDIPDRFQYDLRDKIHLRSRADPQNIWHGSKTEYPVRSKEPELRSWVKEPQPDYSTTRPEHRNRWGLMEPIIEESQHTDPKTQL